MTSTSQSWFKDLFVLLVLFSVIYSLFLNFRPLDPPDEGRYVEIAREMVITGDYLTPRLNTIKYFEKPPLFYWLESLAIKSFGINEWPLRLSTEIMGILGCLIVYAATRKLYDRRTAILSSLILGSAALYIGLSHYITLDMTLSTFLTGSLLAFIVGNHYPPGKTRRNFMWLMYIFAALATLTKGLIGIIFPGMIIFTWLCLTWQWRELRSYSILSGICLFLAIALPWHVLVQLKNPEFFDFYFVKQHFLRYFTDYADRRQAAWFLPTILTVGFFPWTGFAIVAFKNYLLYFRKVKQYPTETFLILWLTLIFLFYWVSKSQLPAYIIPIFAPLAIMTGRYISNNWEKRTIGTNFGFVLATLFSLAITIATVIFAHHKSYSDPALYLVYPMPFLFILGTCIYFRKQVKLGYQFLLLGCLSLIIFTHFNIELFEERSIKPIANKIITYLQPTDIIYNFNHYYQDLPVYIGRNIKIVNWTGELTFGCQHQDSKNDFINNQQLINEWNNPLRKFMVAKKKELLYIQNDLKLKFWVVSTGKRDALICNQEIKP